MHQYSESSLQYLEDNFQSSQSHQQENQNHIQFLNNAQISLYENVQEKSSFNHFEEPNLHLDPYSNLRYEISSESESEDHSSNLMEDREQTNMRNTQYNSPLEYPILSPHISEIEEPHNEISVESGSQLEAQALVVLNEISVDEAVHFDDETWYFSRITSVESGSEFETETEFNERENEVGNDSQNESESVLLLIPLIEINQSEIEVENDSPLAVFRESSIISEETVSELPTFATLLSDLILEDPETNTMLDERERKLIKTLKKNPKRKEFERLFKEEGTISEIVLTLFNGSALLKNTQFQKITDPQTLAAYKSLSKFLIKGFLGQEY